MVSFVVQIGVLSRISLRTCARRGWITASMVVSIALTTMLLLGFLSMASGFRTVYTSAGAGDVAIGLSAGATSEGASRLSMSQVHFLEAAPGIARSATGEALTSAELQVAVDALPIGSTLPSSLSLRGIGANGFRSRPDFKLVEGRMFQPGRAEIVVGREIADSYQGFQVGQQVTLGSSVWTVTGIMEAGGSVFESEMFSDLAVVQTLFDRQGVYQSVRMRLSDPDALAQINRYVEENRASGVRVLAEKAYYADQSSRTSTLILWFGVPLALAISVGAIVGTINTMAASVSDRAAEIATVRALGFRQGATFLATILESCVLAITGAAIGIVLTCLLLNGWAMSTVGSNGTQVGFALSVSSDAVVQSTLLAVVIGIFGGGFPAAAAARAPVRDVLRQQI